MIYTFTTPELVFLVTFCLIVGAFIGYIIYEFIQCWEIEAILFEKESRPKQMERSSMATRVDQPKED